MIEIDKDHFIASLNLPEELLKHRTAMQVKEERTGVYIDMTLFIPFAKLDKEKQASAKNIYKNLKNLKNQ